MISMAEIRRRGKNNRKKANINDFKLKTYIPVDELDNYILYLFTESPLITRRALSNLNRLFQSLDERLFEHDPSLISRIFYIREVVDAKLRRNIHDYNILLNYPKNEYYNDYIQNNIIPFVDNNTDLSDGTIKYINHNVEQILKYNYLLFYKDDLADNLNKLEMGEYSDLDRINSDMKETIQTLMRHMRNTEVNDERSSEFDLTEESFDTVMADILQELKSPSNFLKTGVKTLNNMLWGGFECSRSYIFFGIPGMGKSVLLLSLAYQLLKYNQNLKPKDPEKKLTVLYITQENSLKETMERLWNIAISDDKIVDYDLLEVKQMFKDAGLLFGGEESKTNVNLRIRYYPHRAISTDDLYSIIDDLSDSGEEVIALVHDYTKRIRPSFVTGDLRLDLGEVMNEFNALAKFYDIPVITAGQINREGASIIENALQSGQEDFGKKLSANNIGESFQLYENTDCAYILTREIKDEQYYLSLKEIKARGKKVRAGQPNVTYFVHPFYKENTIRLIEDENTDVVLSSTSLSNLGGGMNPVGGPLPNTNSSARAKSRITPRRTKPQTTGFEHKDADDDLSDLD